MSIVIDSSNAIYYQNESSGTVNISTNKNNQIILLTINITSNIPINVLSVTDKAGLTFNKKESSNNREIWWALSLKPLKEDVIEVKLSSNPINWFMNAIAVSGANLDSPFNDSADSSNVANILNPSVTNPTVTLILY